MTLKLPLSFIVLKYINAVVFALLVIGMFSNKIYPGLQILFYTGAGFILLGMLLTALVYFKLLALHVKCPQCKRYITTTVQHTGQGKISRQSLRYTCHCVNCGYSSH